MGHAMSNCNIKEKPGIKQLRKDVYMTIKEICDILKSYLYNDDFEYGFVLNGQKYKPNMNAGFDHHWAKTVVFVGKHKLIIIT